MKFVFDMDGTIADLYSVENWLADLRAFKSEPYLNAKPMVNMSLLARYIHTVQKNGHSVEIVSWGSKESNENYDSAVTEAKKAWLKKHLPSVVFNAVIISAYGIEKSTLTEKAEDAILFDDNENVRASWQGRAYAPEQIFEIMKKEGFKNE